MDDRTRVWARGATTGLAAEGDSDCDGRSRGVGERIEPPSPVRATVDVDRSRNDDATHMDGSSRGEAVAAVEAQAESTHHLAVEARLGNLVDEDPDTAKPVQRRAVGRCLPCPYLGGANAASIDAG